MTPESPKASQAHGSKRGYYIFVTEACNLRCSYCFVRDKQNHRHLTDELGDKTVEFIVEDAAAAKSVYVHFFGGEPLIRPATVDRLAARLRSWGGNAETEVRLGITTNGTLLTIANCEMLKRHDIGVQLSLDGGKTGNDIHRQFMGGTQSGLRPSGAFDLVKIENYVRYFGRGRPNCRMTVTVHNLPYLSQSIRELHEIGFKSFSLIPDADCGDWTAPDFARYEREMQDVFQYWAEHRELSFNVIDQTISRLVEKKQRRHLCPAGSTILGITVDGDLYPCHDFAGRFWPDPACRESLLLGNVATGCSPERREAFKPIPMERAKSANNHECSVCWAKSVCGRGCPYMNYARSGDMALVNSVFCATTRIHTTLALQWMSVLPEYGFSDASRRAPAKRAAPANVDAGRRNSAGHTPLVGSQAMAELCGAGSASEGARA